MTKEYFLELKELNNGLDRINKAIDNILLSDEDIKFKKELKQSLNFHVKEGIIGEDEAEEMLEDLEKGRAWLNSTIE